MFVRSFHVLWTCQVMPDRRYLRIVDDDTHDDIIEHPIDIASELIANQAKVARRYSVSLAKIQVFVCAAIALAILVAVWPKTGNTDNSGRSTPVSVQPAVLSHWLSASSGVRHNSSCRWYGKSGGRKCRGDEGRPCHKCGG
jgi:hypothetical protein